MNHSTELLIVLLIAFCTVGCGEPNPPGAGGTANPATRIPEGLDERHAANYLEGAKQLQATGEPKQAIATLNELIAKYPESDAAEEAKQILAKLEKSNADSGEVEDGGSVPNADRDKAAKFLAALAKVKSAEEEKNLLTEFGNWLRENEYNVEITLKDGKHNILCPHFPPETPWARHAFLDEKNLELLPRNE